MTTLGAATLKDINAAFATGTLTSEALVEACLARIETYDEHGPQLNAVSALNSAAVTTARALDVERAARGPRSALHGVPVVLKDNIDTFDMPTTAGSVFLEGWTPQRDAEAAKRLRDAGAVIIAKVATSEFAVSSFTSLGGRPKNPHDLERSALSSSSGAGVAIAAGYATVGIGTDTGGSIRAPASANGIAGLKPTFGLISRRGIVPLAPSLDAVGPMARSVYDLAVTLGILAGSDPADASTQVAASAHETDYTHLLVADALKGARIGVARDFLGQDMEVDWVIEAAIDRMKSAGATLTEVRLPQWLLECKGAFYTTIRHTEFAGYIGDYLADTAHGYPKSMADLVDRARRFTVGDGRGRPNPSRWALFELEAASGGLAGSQYMAIRDFGLPMVRAVVTGLFEEQDLDAVIYPTLPERPLLVTTPDTISYGPDKPTNIANLTGLPDLTIPAGFTSSGLPVGLSLLGRAFSEARLLALGYGIERQMVAFRTPVHAPPLPGESGVS
jgi:amidase